MEVKTVAGRRKYEAYWRKRKKQKIEAAIRDPKASRTTKCRGQILKLSDAGADKQLSQRQMARQIGVSL